MKQSAPWRALKDDEVAAARSHAARPRMPIPPPPGLATAVDG
ncbi:MAG: hypothetical protein ACOVVK_13110 [Elsteraceae bacterium]